MTDRWWNVNENGEAYDSHPTEAAARLVQAEFPNDVVVQAPSAEEAERLAFAPKPTVLYTLQPADSPDGRRPWPFHVKADGTVVTRGMIGFYRRVVGFADDLSAERIDLWWADYVAGDPQAVINKYVVTCDVDGQFATHLGAIQSVETREGEGDGTAST